MSALLARMDTKDMLTDNRYDVRVQHDGAVKINIPQYVTLNGAVVDDAKLRLKVTCICRLQIERFPFDGK